MPSVRKLRPEEVQALENKGKGTRKITEEQYDAILRDFEVGEYGELTLDEGESRLTVRNRLKAAAKRRNVGVSFKRARGDIVRFQVVEDSSNGNGASTATAPDEEPAVNSGDLHPVPKPSGSGRRGRPKKSAEE